MKPIIRLNLRLIVDEVDFRQSEATMFASLSKADKARVAGPGDAVCFVSKTGTQLCFVYRATSLGIRRGGGVQQVIASARLRLTRGTWNPEMLQDYAAQAGVELEGLRFYRDRYREQLARKAAAA